MCVRSRMSNIIRRLRYNYWYIGKPPWESGVVPPEVVNFIESHNPGYALDIGCGTGTSSIALNSSGWQVTGLDFSFIAIRLARKKAIKARSSIKFIYGDLSCLDDLNGSFQLILDIGCLHNLSTSQLKIYHRNLYRLLAHKGFLLLYSILKVDPRSTSPGVDEDFLMEFFQPLKLISRQNGEDRNRQSVWLTFQKI